MQHCVQIHVVVTRKENLPCFTRNHLWNQRREDCFSFDTLSHNIMVLYLNLFSLAKMCYGEISPKFRPHRLYLTYYYHVLRFTQKIKTDKSFLRGSPLSKPCIHIHTQ